MNETDYLNELFTNWCECSPYGEQVPDDWPELMAEFVKQNAGRDRDHMAELIMEGFPDNSFERLLESIFKTSCRFVLRSLSDAACDKNLDKLKLIGISEVPKQADEVMVDGLRWHRLSEFRRDDVGTIELLAATCVDGIGCVARWTRREDGGWDVEAWDTEQQGPMEPVTNFIGCEEGGCVPPAPPTVFDDAV